MSFGMQHGTISASQQLWLPATASLAHSTQSHPSAPRQERGVAHLVPISHPTQLERISIFFLRLWSRQFRSQPRKVMIWLRREWSSVFLVNITNAMLPRKSFYPLAWSNHLQFLNDLVSDRRTSLTHAGLKHW